MQIYSLNGDQWLMRQVGQEQWHKAEVPGSVYADLMRDGTIPDPFYRENELETFITAENEQRQKTVLCISVSLKRKKPCCRATRCCCAARDWTRWPT